MDGNATSGVWEKHEGEVYWLPFGVLAENVKTDAEHQFLTDAEKKNITDAGGGTVRFEKEPEQRKLLESGSRPGRLFAWINRWLRDLKTVAFTGSYPDLTDRPQLGAAASKGVSNSTGITRDGYVADARAVKVVNDKFGGMSFTREGGDIYAVYTEGADTVRKNWVSGTRWNCRWTCLHRATANGKLRRDRWTLRGTVSLNWSTITKPVTGKPCT